MRPFLSRTQRGAVLSAALVLAFFNIAHATELGVDPVRIDLGPGVRGGLLMLRNKGQEPVRVHASVHTWSQDEEGRMALAPTQEVFFFPSMLTLAPGESRPIRVGSPAQPPDAERAFRLIVEELPPQASPATAPTVRVLTRLSIPVFLLPKQPHPEMRIEGVELRAGRLSFRTTNTGTLHVMSKQVRVQGLKADGTVQVRKELAGWYVLAGGTRAFALELTAADCQSLTSAEIEVETDQGTFRETVKLPAGQCGR